MNLEAPTGRVLGVCVWEGRGGGGGRALSRRAAAAVRDAHWQKGRVHVGPPFIREAGEEVILLDLATEEGAQDQNCEERRDPGRGADRPVGQQQRTLGARASAASP